MSRALRRTLKYALIRGTQSARLVPFGENQRDLRLRASPWISLETEQ